MLEISLQRILWRSEQENCVVFLQRSDYNDCYPCCLLEGEMPANWHSELSKIQIERPLEETETSQCISRVLARGVLASGNQELRSAI